MLFYFIVSLLIFFTGALVLNSVRRIEADPPHIALVTRLGKILPKVKQEGLRLFLGYPWLCGYILIKVEEVVQEIPKTNVRTPDGAESSVPVGVTWIPDYFTPKNLIEYHRSGGQQGAARQLEGIIVERLREWGTSDGEGPQTWEELRSSGSEAVAILLKEIVGDELSRIPSDVPTWILHKYFHKPQIKPTKKEAEIWGENWENVESQIAKENKGEIREALTCRERAIAAARQARGQFCLPALGIILKRLNVGEIDVMGKVAEMAEQEAKEKQERKAETEELEHMAQQMLRMMRPRSQGGLGFTAEQALEAFQTERSKVTKSILEQKLNISPETRTLLLKMVKEASSVVLAARGGVQ